MKYKEGDIVTIRKFIPYHTSDDKVPGFVVGMEKYLGCTFKISSIYGTKPWFRITDEFETNRYTWCEEYMVSDRYKKLKRVLC